MIAHGGALKITSSSDQALPSLPEGAVNCIETSFLWRQTLQILVQHCYYLNFILFIRATQLSAEMCHIVISSCPLKTKNCSKKIKIDKPLLRSTKIYKTTAWKLNFLSKNKKRNVKFGKECRIWLPYVENIQSWEQWNINTKLYPD